MGLDLNGIRFLLYAHKLGVNFNQTAMIGRQSLDLTKFEVKHIFQAFKHSVSSEQIDNFFNQTSGYAEPLLIHLGAKNVDSFDFSGYEEATKIYDLNQEIPANLHEKYSVVLDGGSLEHVFNFPIAIKNCMEMLNVGGHYLGITPTNNFMGHGFYQFSPELYFSIFTQQNGFELINLIALEDKPSTTWYSVNNPSLVKDRVSLINNQPVYLLVLAKKVEKTKVFKITPQQSDYVDIWNQSENNKNRVFNAKKQIPFRNWVKKNFPFFVKYLIKEAIQGHGFNSRFFSPIDPTKE